MMSESNQAQPSSSQGNPVEQNWQELQDRIHDYVKAEVELTTGEYHLVTQLNEVGSKLSLCFENKPLSPLQVMRQKYEDMLPTAKRVHSTLDAVGESYKGLQAHFDKIDQIEAQVNLLEETAYELDKYSQQLEARFKKIKSQIK